MALVWVARVKGSSPPRYAYFGAESGMGRYIETTTDINHAERRGSPRGLIQRFLAGHAGGYEAVCIDVVETIVEPALDLEPILEEVRKEEEGS